MLVAAVAACLVAVAGCAPSPTTAPGEAPPEVLRPAAPEGELPEPLQSQLQAALDETMSEYEVPGAAAGVWIPGEGAWTTASGLADIESGVPVDVEMTWPMRSVTKSYTVTLLLQLVDEGKVSLDDTIGQYVDGVTEGDEITLRQLADMSSGNADYTNEDFLAAFTEDPETIFTLDELNGFMLDKPAQFAPGTEKIYTNANTNLLGAVIEDVTGEEFADVLDERILGPLGQEGTRYILDAVKWTQPHPVGYAPDGETLAPQPRNISIFGPAGSMITTLDDARVWGQTLATGALLDPATQSERQEGAPLEAGPPYGIYALGIGETDGWWGHNGEGLGFTAAIFHHPDSGATIAVFMNESNVTPKAHPADQMFRRVAQILTTGAER
ncbi:serine hydrolase [Microbacterium sp. AK031]|uniref:serine hydrolase domain-containing protein n=1 Tax=Microbacterium sp. AK031 TaxID=2723076 RepID=UPI002166D401|nr:serine hydrolase domain-containing protein [Microbacterium sp. AK031]MCS3844447.1 D-alanyl-D-alanine carboxypeptidase [Microbacterium sp. AK031]